MRSVLVLFVFALLLAELPVCSAGSDADDDDDGVADAVQIAEEPDVQAGPQAPATIQATVNMAADLKQFGAQKDLKSWGGHSAGPAPAPAAPAPEAKKEKAIPDAKKAHVAFETAKKAATEANTIANHSVHLADNAKSALSRAHDALHNARVDSAGLSKEQKKSLKAAEAKLREATKKAEYGQLKNAQYIKAKVDNKRLEKLESKMDQMKKSSKKKGDDELEALRKEIKELREELKRKEGNKDDNDAILKELQDEIEAMEAAEKKEDKVDKKSHDEMKAEVERLRAQIKSMEDEPPAPPPTQPPVQKEEEVEKYDVKIKPLVKEEKEEEQEQGEATPVEEKGIDIDTAMPYGDLEPFGREDTAQELTESSIKESDGMVDQLERAEVAEEKRSVFRALTRLRGAAITSFDGVARSQTGNIDEYNKIHKWRNTHPLHHLADEESDVSKWAFPDNAD